MRYDRYRVRKQQLLYTATVILLFSITYGATNQKSSSYSNSYLKNSKTNDNVLYFLIILVHRADKAT